jgi:hypothetical protein
VNDRYWDAIWIYALGCLTGAALTGWSPAWLERLVQRRGEPAEKKSSNKMRKILHERGLLHKDDPPRT